MKDGENIMMYKIVKEFPDAIIFEEEGPFISLYQPTHRFSPANKQDPIVFKNLIRKIENSLKQKYSKKDIDSIMNLFYQLEGDQSFWNNTFDGLAILANLNKCIIYKLHKSVKALAIVADSLHIKPLVRIFQSADKYQLLGLSGNVFTLYEGNRFGVDEIEMAPETPRTIEKVLGEQHTDSYLTHGSYGGVGGSTMYHGHGGEKDERDKDIEKFFRYADKFVSDNYSKPSKLPLILVALKEYHNIFMKVSKNSYLMEHGIKGSYDSFKMEQLKEKAWEIIEPIYLEKTQNLVNGFENAKANSLGSDNLSQIARATFENRVETILIEADKIISGKIDDNTGQIEYGNINDPDLDDILDDLAEFVLKKRGEVVVLPKERMPSETGVAAIYRY
jgi:hypothetical protein